MVVVSNFSAQYSNSLGSSAALKTSAADSRYPSYGAQNIAIVIAPKNRFQNSKRTQKHGKIIENVSVCYVAQTMHSATQIMHPDAQCVPIYMLCNYDVLRRMADINVTAK